MPRACPAAATCQRRQPETTEASPVDRTYTLDEINEGFAALRSGQVARGVAGFPA